MENNQDQCAKVACIDYGGNMPKQSRKQNKNRS
jgi:hypothetical protein